VPIYEYQCPACGTSFEELIRSEAAEKNVVCPKCGDRKVRRQPSVFAAHAAPECSPLPRGGCGQCAGAEGGCPLAGE
jgi:putative FmdB family regulatory protein